MAKALEEAKTKLAEIHERAEAAYPDWEALAAKAQAFNYADTRLLAAAQFVKMNGKSIPENAWRQMISDYANRPAELHYLAELFDSNGVVDAALVAADTAKEITFSSTFPQRVTDSLYYICNADPHAEIDTSGIVKELDAMETYEARMEAAEAAAGDA